MIQPRIQFSLANARQYFREHLSAGDYYSQDMKVAGEWLGQGAAKLGLEGTVNEAAFLALCEGRNPSLSATFSSEDEKPEARLPNLTRQPKHEKRKSVLRQPV